MTAILLLCCLPVIGAPAALAQTSLTLEDAIARARGETPAARALASTASAHPLMVR